MEEKTTTGFFEEAPGLKSSTRLNIFIVLINGLILVDAIAFAGIYSYIYKEQHEPLLAIVTAASVILGSTVLPVIGWKSIAKNQENKSE